MNSRKSKTTILFLFIAVGLVIFLSVIIYRATIDKRHLYLQTREENSALRGSIITKDGFSVAISQKLYTAKINTKSIDPNKKEMFIRLYSLYSGEDEKKIRKLINGTNGLLVLSDKIDAKTAMHLKELSRKLYQKKIFVPIDDSSTIQSLNIFESKESRKNRTYMAQNALTPVLGYISQKDDKSIGAKGVERYYNEFLSPIQDARIVGFKDIGRNIIFTSDLNLQNRIDGYNLAISVNLKFQTMVEKIVDAQASFVDAKEIIACVMDSKTGEILALASSLRYDPSSIKQQDIQALNSTATEYAYEIGSVFKPFIFSILLSETKLNKMALVNTHNGSYKLGKRIIKDTHPAPFLTAEDVIAESSNIGMIELAKKLTGTQIYNGLLNFGFTQKSGIDMPYEQTGAIPPAQKLDSQTYKATVSYGYGVSATFMQLMKAYNVFNNKGFAVVPHFALFLELNGKKYAPQIKPPKEIISQEIAKQMKSVLIKVVEKGTGKKALTPGLEVGGKTGTAHIARKGVYGNIYNGSFFGFANDKKGNAYTIGVLAREPKKKYYYYGAQSALPVFKKIVDLMVAEGYLMPDETAINQINNK
ncbi:peptidoglycan D,D-transpeptidase FtsI family protein [Campylobacter gastrosuis]|uniref:Penicillin-binding protein 2 n=1 Tax=Campylobacter gastrosuis TaxID=2974576 RepID=A0ABT7HMI0_9BACT|nr:penicillin-binding protein 2 [Campylobacter gastrosuis]MDL0087932.1 penicillin-binding protein 2 [Campylobacter gastrosuis]